MNFISFVVAYGCVIGLAVTGVLLSFRFIKWLQMIGNRWNVQYVHYQYHKAMHNKDTPGGGDLSWAKSDSYTVAEFA